MKYIYDTSCIQHATDYKEKQNVCKTKFYNSVTVSETRVVFFNTLKNAPTSKPDCTLLIQNIIEQKMMPGTTQSTQ